MIARYWRFIAFLATGVAVGGLLWPRTGVAPAILLGFDAGALVFFATLVSLVRGATAETMRQRSQANEPDHHWLLILAAGVAAVTIIGIWVELVAIKAASVAERGAMIALATLSLAIVWLFANAVSAIHYGHLWYLRGPDNGKQKASEPKEHDSGGLDFPGPDLAPDYLDFTYFAVVLSMTFQVSDVTISSKPIRRLALVHGLVAFLFNIGVIAVSVSLVTSALGN